MSVMGTFYMAFYLQIFSWQNPHQGLTLTTISDDEKEYIFFDAKRENGRCKFSWKNMEAVSELRTEPHTFDIINDK